MQVVHPQEIFCLLNTAIGIWSERRRLSRRNLKALIQMTQQFNLIILDRASPISG
jgi:hypothetical protein